jgi:long-chain acyl-CoA synthetase
MAWRTLHDWLAYHRRFSGEVAVIQHRGYRREPWTYGRLLALAERFARELGSRNIAPGDRVVLWGADSAQWIGAFLGCLMRGVVAVPLDRAGAPDFAARVIRQVQARLLLLSHDMESPLPGMATLQLESLEESVRACPAGPVAAELTPQDALQIVFTSGTTAEPRGVVTTHANVIANLEPFAAEIEKYRRYEHFVHPLRFLELVPLSHVFGQFLGIFLPPLLGGTVVFPSSLSPAEVTATIKRDRVSVLVAVPRMLQSLKQKIEDDFAGRGRTDWLALELERAKDSHFLRRWWRFRGVHGRFGWKFWAIISGGAALDPATGEFFERLGFAVLQGYGLTETTSLVSVDHPFRRGKGSLGKVLPGRDLKLGEDGEIMVRGGGIAAGYWQAGRLTPVTGDEGWFHTGDLGELDAEGYLRFKGRRKSVIVTAEGMKVFPTDLETALRRQPEIKDASVFGLDRGGNAEACAVLLPQVPGADLTDAVKRANATLAAHQQLRTWFVWPQADLPRTATQKPRLDVLQEFVRARLGGQAPGHDAGELQQMIARVRGTPATGAEDLGDLSSLERVELLCALEGRYQVDLGDSALAAATSLRDLEVALARPAEERSTYAYPRWAQRWPVTWLRVAFFELLLRPITLLLAGPRIEGAHHLRDLHGPVLVVANHVTYIDGALIYAALPFRLRRRMASAMEGNRLENMRRPSRTEPWIMRLLLRPGYYLLVFAYNVFPLPQWSGFRKSFAYAGESVDRGYNVLIFPEGRRTTTGVMSQFRSGIGMLATGLGVPVLPVRLHGLWNLKLKRKRFAPRGAIRVVFGEPVRYSAGRAPEEVAHDLHERVAEL